jgi:hypothetical protein
MLLKKSLYALILLLSITSLVSPTILGYNVKDIKQDFDSILISTYDDSMNPKATFIPDLSYKPESHDFGDIYQGESDSTTFEIWNSGDGDCPPLIYSFIEECSWIDVKPENGTCYGERDKIWVGINTADMELGDHSYDILILSNCGEGNFSVKVNIIEFPNDPPLKPSIEGETSGIAGDRYTYFFNSTDPDEDKIYYWIDWGDGNNSEWIGPYISGDQNSKSYRWIREGNYTVKIKAKDIYDAESDWAMLLVSMPKNKSNVINPLFFRYLENNSYLLSIIQKISGHS